MEKIPNLAIKGAKVLFESKFSKHVYDEKTKIFYSDWFEETKEMTENDFKLEMIVWLKTSREIDFKYLFDRCVDFIYPITPEEQIWMAELLNKNWIEAGLIKYAHIVPEEFVSSISVEQTFEEFFNMNLPNQYPIKDFSNIEEAIAWLQS